MMERNDPGPTYTSGRSFRARAEARQCEYHSKALMVGRGRYGHFLAEDAANFGANLITSEAFNAARELRIQGKGMAVRAQHNEIVLDAIDFGANGGVSPQVWKDLEEAQQQGRKDTTEGADG